MAFITINIKYIFTQTKILYVHISLLSTIIEILFNKDLFLDGSYILFQEANCLLYKQLIQIIPLSETVLIK